MPCRSSHNTTWGTCASQCSFPCPLPLQLRMGSVRSKPSSLRGILTSVHRKLSIPGPLHSVLAMWSASTHSHSVLVFWEKENQNFRNWRDLRVCKVSLVLLALHAAQGKVGADYWKENIAIGNTVPDKESHEDSASSLLNWKITVWLRQLCPEYPEVDFK